jgi:hypothetical protein
LPYIPWAAAPVVCVPVVGIPVDCNPRAATFVKARLWESISSAIECVEAWLMAVVLAISMLDEPVLAAPVLAEPVLAEPVLGKVATPGD